MSIINIIGVVSAVIAVLALGGWGIIEFLTRSPKWQKKLGKRLYVFLCGFTGLMFTKSGQDWQRTKVLNKPKTLAVVATLVAALSFGAPAAIEAVQGVTPATPDVAQAASFSVQEEADRASDVIETVAGYGAQEIETQWAKYAGETLVLDEDTCVVRDTERRQATGIGDAAEFPMPDGTSEQKLQEFYRTIALNPIYASIAYEALCDNPLIAPVVRDAAFAKPYLDRVAEVGTIDAARGQEAFARGE